MVSPVFLPSSTILTMKWSGQKPVSKRVKQVEYLLKKKLVNPATTWPAGAEKLRVSRIPFSQPEAGLMQSTRAANGRWQQ